MIRRFSGLLVRLVRKPLHNSPPQQEHGHHNWIQSGTNILVVLISAFAIYWSVHASNESSRQFREQFAYQRKIDSIKNIADSTEQLARRKADSIQLELVRATIKTMEAQTKSLSVIESAHKAAIDFNMII